MISHLERLLKTGDIQRGLEVLRNWLAVAEPGEPELMLLSASDAIRPKVVLLMRDLLSRYPATIVGVPLLLVASPDFEDTSAPWSSCLTLPPASPEARQPCMDMEFLGWAPSTLKLPLTLPIAPEQLSAAIPWSKPTSIVALFRTTSDVFDLDSVDIPNSWWGTFFQDISANIYMTGRLVLPYPDALEAARVMQAYVQGNAIPGKSLFITDTHWNMACDEAAYCLESCRHRIQPEF